MRRGNASGSDRDRLLDPRVLNALGIGQMLETRSGGRPGNPLDFADLDPPGTRADDAADVVDDWHDPAAEAGRTGTTTAHCAVDEALSPSRITALHRMLQSVAAPRKDGSGKPKTKAAPAGPSTGDGPVPPPPARPLHLRPLQASIRSSGRPRAPRQVVLPVRSPAGSAAAF